MQDFIPPASRNAPCPCGSGRRYKACHGAPEAGPDDAEALFELGSLAHARGEHASAIDYLTRAERSAPGNIPVLTNLGLALQASGKLAEAEARFRKACELAPGTFGALANLAQNLYLQKRFAEALVVFDDVVAEFEVRDASIWANRGVCAVQCGAADTADQSFRAALRYHEDSPELHRDLASLALERKRYDEAVLHFERALVLDSDSLAAASGLLFARQNLASWGKDFTALRERVLEAARHAVPNAAGGTIPPYNLLTISDDPALQRRVAEAASVPALHASSPREARDNLRLGFVSRDFSDHPVGRLVVELIERLDRSRFQVTLYSAGRRKDATSRRLSEAADVFRDVASSPDLGIADLIRDDGIDVLFDLDGHTGHPFSDLFGARPAPMQGSFLGYAGTMGSGAYDFVVSDRHCIGEAPEHYGERPLFVEPCYLPSDSRRDLDPVAVARGEYGLPDDALVLCAFANTYKILPEMFRVWLRALERHGNAVLWLRDAGEEVNGRLRAEAAAQGIDAHRLRFAPIEPLPKYLARFRLADLFCDTAPFGSHTTVNDALFAGVPVVTLDGASFAGRASASQVLAAGLPELVARDIEAYAAIVDRLLANDTERREVRGRLRSARTGPLFDMVRYARSFEQALLAACRNTG